MQQHLNLRIERFSVCVLFFPRLDVLSLQIVRRYLKNANFLNESFSFAV